MTLLQAPIRPGLLLAGLLALAACGGEDRDWPRPEHAPEAVADPPRWPQIPAEPKDPPPPDYRSQSLYQGPEPRPGPPLLYQSPPRAPQLENVGIWRANPILISGASAYRRGEFLYQDFLYDDSGADGMLEDPQNPRRNAGLSSSYSGTYAYPTDPVYAGNAADLVEFRVKPHAQWTAFRITLNSLLDPDRVAFSIALGDSDTPRAFPHGANVSAPAELFITVFEGRADIRDAKSGEPLYPPPVVSVDLERRQFEVKLLNSVWDPGRRTIRMAAGVGLWDAANGRYLTPRRLSSRDAAGGAGLLLKPPAFFNVAFRYGEPVSPWRDEAQAKALQQRDISRFYAKVDFAKLHRQENDDMLGQPGGVPAYGPMNRIYASRFDTGQGVAFDDTCGSGGSAEACIGGLRGTLQPYAIYVPKPVEADAAPEKGRQPEGRGLTLLLHSLGGNHNQYLGSRNQSQLGDRGDGHIVVTPAGRGPDGWYSSYAAADVFEVWTDVARHYRLDPQRTAISGYSMGGYGTFRFASRYPDLFGRAHTVVGPPGQGIWIPPLEPTGGGEASNSYYQLEGVRNIPFLMWVAAADELVPYLGTSKQAKRFDELGFRYRFDTFLADEHLSLAINDEYGPSAEFLGEAWVERNPRRVSYVVNPRMDFEELGLTGSHAYWLSELLPRDSSGAAPRARVDATSYGFGLGEPAVGARQYGGGTLSGGRLGPRLYTSQWREWEPAPETAADNRLTIKARNLAAMTVHVSRARLGCDVELEVDTDGPLAVELAGCGRTEYFK